MTPEELTDEVLAIRKRLHDLVDKHFSPLAERVGTLERQVAVLEAPPKSIMKLNGTAQRLVWWLVGISGTVILLLLGGWGTSVERRMDALSGVIERRVEKVETRQDATATEQARRTSRISRLEEGERDLRAEVQAIKNDLQAIYRGTRRP